MRLPFLLVPHRQDIARWMPTRLQNTEDQSKSKTAKESARKTENIQRQKRNREMLSQYQSNIFKNVDSDQSKQIFVKKHFWVLLHYPLCTGNNHDATNDSYETQIITSVHFRRT